MCRNIRRLVDAKRRLGTEDPDLRVVFGESFVMPDGTEARAIKFLGAPSLE